MPYKAVKRKGKYRLVDSSGHIAKNKAGTALDGGCSSSKAKVESQNRAIMASESRKKGK